VFTSAKNTISVGGVDARDGRLYKWSSLGPTFDGRIKPDVVAPSCYDSLSSSTSGVLAASKGTQDYEGKCGTSMAAPLVTGVIALMAERHGAGALQLRPSTYKAILIHSATDLSKPERYASREFDNPDTKEPVIYHAGPDFATGFGLVDPERAVSTIGDRSIWVERSVNQQGQTIELCAEVRDGAPEIKAVIAWDDLPGPTSGSATSPKLVNDLDLVLRAPDGTRHLPWTLDPLPVTSKPGEGDGDPISTSDIRPAKRGIDRRNNVELVSIPAPAAGRWQLQVTAYRLPQGGTQRFSLVSSHRVLQSCAFPEIALLRNSVAVGERASTMMGDAASGQSEDRARYTFTLGDREVVLVPGIADEVLASFANSQRKAAAVLLQLERPMTPELDDALRSAGFEIGAHLGGNAYTALLHAHVANNRPALPLRSMRPLGAEEKVGVRVLADIDARRTTLSVLFFESITSEVARSVLARHSSSFQESEFDGSWTVEINGDEIIGLAAEPFVHRIRKAESEQ
jgi:hypothetical protein